MRCKQQAVLLDMWYLIDFPSGATVRTTNGLKAELDIHFYFGLTEFNLVEQEF